jgi:hypothetical protein
MPSLDHGRIVRKLTEPAPVPGADAQRRLGIAVRSKMLRKSIADLVQADELPFAIAQRRNKTKLSSIAARTGFVSAFAATASSSER